MDDIRYDKLLYGDISAITAFKRVCYIKILLKRQDLHHRFI